MARIKARMAGTVASTMILAAVGLVWTSGDAAAYGQCVETIPSDHHWVSVSCPTQPGGTQFRVKTYVCTSDSSGCGSTPVYGQWAPWGGTSTVSAGFDYVDFNRVTIEVGYPVPVD
ncbi:hypothetical protein [Jatrophihabitans sp.]|jgi:hypothetical protein|uniref:hypothetical protein n=1 Tax=Jatrophihabitans sp. TaxID=1932789 RepID=UPI002EFC575F